MKCLNYPFLIATLTLTVPMVYAQQHDEHMNNMQHSSEKSTTSHTGKGVVVSVDAEKQSVVLKHEPIPSLNWPSMTMGFKVKDEVLLEKISDNKAVNFEFVQQGNDYVIVAVE